MDKFLFNTGNVNYHGPVTLVAWMIIHPWMTLIIALSFCEALGEFGKALGKWGKKK